MYSQLKNLILDKIKSGEYSEDSKIPSELELCESYNISRPTVRQAINELTNNGYLYKIKGKGTFVAKSESYVELRDSSGFTDFILDPMHNMKRRIISANILKSSSVKHLDEVFGNLPANRMDFAQIKFVTLKNMEVLCFNVSYVPLNLFPNIIECVNENKTADYILTGKYPLIPAKAKTSVQLIYTDHIDAQYLQIQAGQALIKIQNILYSKSGLPVEYVIAKYRADKCKLFFENLK